MPITKDEHVFRFSAQDVADLLVIDPAFVLEQINSEKLDPSRLSHLCNFVSRSAQFWDDHTRANFVENEKNKKEWEKRNAGRVSGT